MSGRNFRAQSATAVANKRLQNAVRKTADLLTTMRAKTTNGKPGFEELRTWGRSRKLAVSGDVEHWSRMFAGNLSKLGATVHWAKDGAEARRIIVTIARERGITTAVKSKSMTTEEIELNTALEHAGVEVTETDLGEFIIQLAGERPSHIMAPAIHRNQDEVRQLFAEKLGAPADLDVEGMVRFARSVLRLRFLTAGMGITGCNFAVADSGTIAIVTNEGNGRMCTTLPNVQVALVGLEKLIPSVHDLPDFLSLLTCSATGQRASSYINLTTGPRRFGETEGPQELHVVLLDNGRRAIAASPWREIMHCLHCSACLNHCPVYRAVGGHAYESPYCGPMGSVLSSTLWGTVEYPDLPNACTLCGSCAEVCGVKIPLPEFHRSLRNRNGKTAFSSTIAAWLTAFPGGYATAIRLLGKVLRHPQLAGFLPGINKSAANWALNHQLPQPKAEQDFRQWWLQRRRTEPQPQLRGASVDQVQHSSVPPAASTEQDLYALYCRRAALLGVEVTAISLQDIPDRLQKLRREEDASIVALPRGGWPKRLHQVLLDSLVAGECQVAECSADQAFDITLLDHARIGITYSRAYFAETGSLIFTAGPGYGTLASLLPEVQLTLTPRTCLYADLKSYMADTPQAMPSRLIQASGPSRTGDIEGTMTVGVHGPRRVIHWILDDAECV